MFEFAEPRTSLGLRADLVDILRRNLVGPTERKIDDDLACERLGEAPSGWYLTGFLTPADDTPVPEGRDDGGEAEELELSALEAAGAGAGGAAADDEAPEAPTVRRRFMPSSLGLTVMLPADVTSLVFEATWGDYLPEPPLPPEVLVGETTTAPKVDWVRRPGKADLVLDLPSAGEMRTVLLPPDAAPAIPGGALEVGIQARPFELHHPNGATEHVQVVSVFLVNRRRPLNTRYSDATRAFQVRIALRCEAGFRPQLDLSRYRSHDDDEQLADLHYRDVAAYAVGRSTAVDFRTDPDGRVREVWTNALPKAAVERVEPAPVAGVEFGMEALATLARVDVAGLSARLSPLLTAYAAWSETQKAHAAADPEIAGAERRVGVAARLVANQAKAHARMSAGVELLRTDAKARRAFEIMNRAIAMSARQRNGLAEGMPPEAVRTPEWRPFQLAFILLNLPGMVDKTDPDRDVVDLLFFPTGGGKTEAYLGLAAFTMAHRRLCAGEMLGAGVSVIMRYTLRLLTLDQLGRAAGLMCALELLRLGPEYVGAGGDRELGDWPLEIGLWVGSDASPNVLGSKGNAGDGTAVKRVKDYRSGRDKRAPAPIKACPWCGTPFDKTSFSCVPGDVAPTNLEIRCASVDCPFTGAQALPIVVVDEAIYRRLPAFLIATIDKFAALPWRGEAGGFFGHVKRYDAAGFYGAMDPGRGKPLPNGWALDPPDLIIQDELHLISGPLGTVAGLYEAAIDRLATRTLGGRRVRPKIVASTATVRRAHQQILALFDRDDTQVFPAPGVDRKDSFFATTKPESEAPARWYLGLASGGRGPKLIFKRVLTTLLAASQAMADKHGEAADAYRTALCYFNALRELGGARRMVEDEVRSDAASYGGDRRRLAPHDHPFADRDIGEPLELTSRVSTDEVAQAKARLEQEFGKGEAPVDVALATNMISVGLDITRLGLMLVQGQPKTAAEYIQATSRVGRSDKRPGLVVTVLNLHKPRDRMHYEQFCHFHSTFYRAVEATSVTPWSARALDRALAAVVVSIARHLSPDLTPSAAVSRLSSHPEVRAEVLHHLLARAPATIVGGKEGLRVTLESLLDDWIAIAAEQTQAGGQFVYDMIGAQRLLHAPLDKAINNLKPEHRRFQAGWSMRDVEPGVRLKPLDPYGGKIANAEDLA